MPPLFTSLKLIYGGGGKKNEMKDLCSNWPYDGSGPDTHDWSDVESLLSHLIKMDEEMAQYHLSPRGHMEWHESIEPYLKSH